MAIRRVDDVLGTGGGAETQGQLAALRAEVQAGSDGAERDHRVLDRLVDIRSAKADDSDDSATDAAYADAFKEAGIDLAALPPAEAGAVIKAHPPATAQALAVALDDWADVRWQRRHDRAGANRLSDAARAADPDPWRGDLRAALNQPDKLARLTALQAAVRSARFDTMDAGSLDLLGVALDSAGDPAAAETVLRAAQRRHPGDVWINYDLAGLCEKRNRRDDALRFYTAARSIRPESAHVLAHLLDRKGESDEAIAVFQDLVRLRPRHGLHLGCLGILLQKLGRSGEAGPILEAAVVAGRAAIQLQPDFANAHSNLGIALYDQGKLDEAVAEYRAAIRLQPDFAGAHYNLGNGLRAQGKNAEAIDAYRAAIGLEPGYAEAHTNLGTALRAQGKLDEAIAELREAIRLKPDLAPAQINLRYTEQMIAAAGRLPAVLKGEDTPRDAAELQAFVKLCRNQGRHAASARLLADALTADPKLGDDRQTGYRYDAACYAALAGCAKSKDDPPPDETARAALRQQALDWLKAERAAWAQLLESGPPQTRATIVKRLKHWQQDADLAGVREAEALTQLPEGEQQAWHELWSDVATLLKKAQGDRP